MVLALVAGAALATPLGIAVRRRLFVVRPKLCARLAVLQR